MKFQDFLACRTSSGVDLFLNGLACFKMGSLFLKLVRLQIGWYCGTLTSIQFTNNDEPAAIYTECRPDYNIIIMKQTYQVTVSVGIFICLPSRTFSLFSATNSGASS